MLQQPVEWPVQVNDTETAYFDLYFERFDDKRYVVGVLGDIAESTPLVRIESACIFGHVFQGVHCDCGSQWRQALEKMIDEGQGILIYSVDDDARGHGIETHFDLYVLRQHEGITDEEEIFDRWDVPMDVRDYTPVVEVLEELDVDAVNLMTNNPERIEVLEDAGIDVVDRVPLEAEIHEHNYDLLLDEKDWMDYETSYRTHEEWRDAFNRQCETEAGFMLVAGQRDVVAKEFGTDVEPSSVTVDDHEFLTLYVTPSISDDVAEAVPAEVDDVIEVRPDRVQAAQDD